MVIVMWIAFALIVGWGATQKGRPFWFGFLWAAVLSPVVGLIIVLLSRTVTAEEREAHARPDFKGGMNI